MENEDDRMQHDKNNVSSTESMFPTDPSAPPPYSSLSQYLPTSGIPYPQQYPPPYSSTGYPQPYVPPPGGPPYYPQPGVVYPGPPGPNFQAPQPQQEQRQQQAVAVNNQPAGVSSGFVINAPRVSMVGAIVLSCFVFWLCGWIFGGVAFILAMVGQSSAAAGDTRGAIQLRNVSYCLSIAGIVIGIVVIGSIVGAVNSYKGNSKGVYCNYYDDYRSSYRYCK